MTRGVFGRRKNFVKKRTGIYFSMFIENRNWDLKFGSENEKRRKLKFLFHFKTKVECLFRPTDWIPNGHLFFKLKMSTEKRIFFNIKFTFK